MKLNGLAEKSLYLFLSYNIEQSYLELEISIVQSKKVNYNRYLVFLARKKKKKINVIRKEVRRCLTCQFDNIDRYSGILGNVKQGFVFSLERKRNFKN